MKAILLLILSPLVGLAQSDLLFILDASGSMKQVTAGKSQIDAAKEALKLALNDIQDGSNVGLRVYAHRENQADKEKSCVDTELMVPIGVDTKDKIKSILDSIDPKGYTPISYSLEQAKNDFDLTKESKKTIILLSDGEETCGGDPAATIKKLIDEGFNVTLHVIGFNVDEKTRSQLKAAALAGNGEYFDVKDVNELTQALSEATKKSYVIEKSKTVYGKEIRGGDSFETAVPLETGVEYRLDHHQKSHEYDYFKVKAEAGQEIIVTLKTLEKGIQIRDDGQVIEGESPYFGGKINAPNREQIVYREIIGKKFGTEEMRAPAGETGEYFLLIGSEYASVHKDHATFTVFTVSKGDLDSDKDAGDSFDTALGIEIGKRYKVNHIGGADKADMFSFSAKTGDTFFVGFIPGSEYTYYTYVKILTEFKENITQKSFVGGQGGKTEHFIIPEDGLYFVEVSLSNPESIAKDYSLELRKVQ